MVELSGIRLLVHELTINIWLVAGYLIFKLVVQVAEFT